MSSCAIAFAMLFLFLVVVLSSKHKCQGLLHWTRSSRQLQYLHWLKFHHQKEGPFEGLKSVHLTSRERWLCVPEGVALVGGAYHHGSR